MIGLSVLICGLFAGAAAASPEAQELPVRSAVLFRNDVALIQREGQLSIDKGAARLPLDPFMVPGSFRATAEGAQVTAIEADPTGRFPSTGERNSNRFASLIGQKLRILLEKGAVEGVVTAAEPSAESGSDRLELTTPGGMRWIDARLVLGFERIEIPTALLTLDAADDASVLMTTSALVNGLGWAPRYQLQLGPDGQAKLHLYAVLHNLQHETFESPEVTCSLAAPAISAGLPSAHEKSSYTVGPVKLSSGKQLQLKIGDYDLRFERLYDWTVANPSTANTAVTADEVHALLAVENTSGATLPNAPVLVRGAENFAAISAFPSTRPGMTAEIPLGPASDIKVEREEVELERKGVAAEGDGETLEWVSMTGSLAIENESASMVRLRIHKTFEGEGIAASDEGRIERVANRLGRTRALSRIHWEIELPAGASKRLTYGYQFWIKPLGQ